MQDVSKMAGVSITSVSHYINQTRYISDERARRIEKAIKKLEYNKSKIYSKKKVIGLLSENSRDPFLQTLRTEIEYCLEKEQFLSLGFNCANIEDIAELRNIYHTQDLDLLIMIGIQESSQLFKRVKKMRIPAILLDSDVALYEGLRLHTSYKESMCRAIMHLKNLGHEDIKVLIDGQSNFLYARLIQYLTQAFKECGVSFDISTVIKIDTYSPYKDTALNDMMTHIPTALITIGDEVSMRWVQFLHSKSLNCPKDISIIAYGVGDWIEVCNPPLSCVSLDIKELASDIVKAIKQRKESNDISSTYRDITLELRSKLKMRSSTKAIAKGPFDEIAENPDVLELSKTDIQKLKRKEYTAVISFHSAEASWTRLNERGIRDVFDRLGIKILAVTDAHFDPKLQSIQINNLLRMSPDVLISIPVDEILTAEAYARVVKSNTKLVLISSIPQGLRPKDYVSCVSLNERENGNIVGNLIGNYMIGHSLRSVGVLTHGVKFFGTEQRDKYVLKTLQEDFSDLVIRAIRPFVTVENAYKVTYSMIQRHPEIEVLYVTWDTPYHFVKKALIDLNRADIAVFTTDLGYEVALDIASKSFVKGISAQKPYEQGRAIALAAANGLLQKSIPPFIGMMPYKLTEENLLDMWWEIYSEAAPQEIIDHIRRRVIV